jgi:hypothetical protein
MEQGLPRLVVIIRQTGSMVNVAISQLTLSAVAQAYPVQVHRLFAYRHVNPNVDHPASTTASSPLCFSDFGIQAMDSNLLGIAGWIATHSGPNRQERSSGL